MADDLRDYVKEGGCSSKISPVDLEAAIGELLTLPKDNLLVGTSSHDDAAVYQISDTEALIFTTDFFPPLCNDPLLFGRIAATNSISDIYAMGGEPIMALNISMFPKDDLDLSIFKDILKGGLIACREANCIIAGGHTINDSSPKYGLAVIGKALIKNITTNDNLKEDEALILTKPIGSGVILSANNHNAVKDSFLADCYDNMLNSNKNAVSLMHKYEVRCATDVTGFGLLGHLLKMTKGSQRTVCIESESIPFLEGALELATLGYIPCSTFKNLEYVQLVEDNGLAVVFNDSLSFELKAMLCDSQTAGGLLMSVKREKAEHLLKELKEVGYPQSKVIGYTTNSTEGSIIVI